MCLIVFAWRQVPQYPLVVAANRDEFRARAAAPMEWWQDPPNVLGGRDLEAGGTWLALSSTGRFAAVTNYRERGRSTAARSRGELVSRFVAGEQSPKGNADAIDPDRYAGFSLLTMSGGELAYGSNRGEPFRRLPPGVYGLSNAALDTPWPKLERAREALRTSLSNDPMTLDDLFAIVADRTPAEHPNGSGGERLEGYSETERRAMSAPFIVGTTYGTRCSTAVIYRADEHIEVGERRFDAAGSASGESRFVFRRD